MSIIIYHHHCYSSFTNTSTVIYRRRKCSRWLLLLTLLPLLVSCCHDQWSMPCTRLVVSVPFAAQFSGIDRATDVRPRVLVPVPLKLPSVQIRQVSVISGVVSAPRSDALELPSTQLSQEILLDLSAAIVRAEDRGSDRRAAPPVEVSGVQR